MKSIETLAAPPGLQDRDDRVEIDGGRIDREFLREKIEIRSDVDIAIDRVFKSQSLRNRAVLPNRFVIGRMWIVEGRGNR